MIRFPPVSSLLTLTLVLAGRATQPEPNASAPGLLIGMLHGLTAILALIASPVVDVRIYAFPNAGFAYDLGFCVGFSIGVIVIFLPILPFIGGFFARKG